MNKLNTLFYHYLIQQAAENIAWQFSLSRHNAFNLPNDRKLLYLLKLILMETNFAGFGSSSSNLTFFSKCVSISAASVFSLPTDTCTSVNSFMFFSSSSRPFSSAKPSALFLLFDSLVNMDVTVICLLSLCTAPFLEHPAAEFQKRNTINVSRMKNDNRQWPVKWKSKAIQVYTN